MTLLSCFEPRQVDSQALLAQALVLGMTGAAGAYWWSAVVPSERTRLGKSKVRFRFISRCPFQRVLWNG